MGEFTAEDFAKASFARHRDGGKAVRFDAPPDGPPWQIGMLGKSTDEYMARTGWVPVVESQVSLDGLAAAWEAAEQATEEAPIREGDVVIVRHGGGFTVEPADRILSGQTHGRERILSRAPREPWADLADVLGDFAIHDHDGKEYPDVLAQKLYGRGVRVTGGDDDE